MADHEDGYEIVDRFFIDQGELTGVSAVEAFVLGVEWAMFRQGLSADNPFEYLVHRANVDRILRLCWAHKRRARAVEQEDPAWVTIEVAG